MKEFEDRAWKDMQRRLDVALPDKKYGTALWKKLLPLSLLAGLIIPVTCSLLFHDDNRSTRLPVRMEQLPAKSSPASAGQWPGHASGKSEATVFAGAVASADVPMAAYPVNKDMVKRLAGIQPESSGPAVEEKVLSVRNDVSVEDPAEAHISEGIYTDVTGMADANVTVTDNNSGSEASAPGRRSLQDKNGSPATQVLNQLVAKDMAYLENNISQARYAALPLKAAGNLFDLSIKVNTYSETKGRYKGAALAPEIQLNVGRTSSFFLSTPVRYRYSNDKVISEEFNNELSKVFDRNDFFTPGEILADEEKVNVHTFDAGVDLGFRQRLGRKLDVGVSGIARYDNIFSQAQVSTSISEFSSAANSAYEDANRNFESKKDGWIFGTGLDIKFRIASRHSVFTNFSYLFNKADRMEISMGYAIRLF